MSIISWFHDRNETKTKLHATLISERTIQLINASATIHDLHIVRRNFEARYGTIGTISTDSSSDLVMQYPDLWQQVSRAFADRENSLRGYEEHRMTGRCCNARYL
jgi:hypothetical protein